MARLRSERGPRLWHMDGEDPHTGPQPFIMEARVWETGGRAREIDRDVLHFELGGAPETAYQRACRALDESEAKGGAR